MHAVSDWRVHILAQGILWDGLVSKCFVNCWMVRMASMSAWSTLCVLCCCRAVGEVV